jgi:hypothetical protein
MFSSESRVVGGVGKRETVRLETLNAVAQLIAARGVIASLFYLAAQIRQNTRSMRAMVVDSLAKSIADLIRPMAADRELMRAFHVVVEDWHGATEDDRMRALPLFFSTFKLFRERMVPATPGHSRCRTMARLGRLHSDVLSSSRCEELVAIA